MNALMMMCGLMNHTCPLFAVVMVYISYPFPLYIYITLDFFTLCYDEWKGFCVQATSLTAFCYTRVIAHLSLKGECSPELWLNIVKLYSYNVIIEF